MHFIKGICRDLRQITLESIVPVERQPAKKRVKHSLLKDEQTHSSQRQMSNRETPQNSLHNLLSIKPDKFKFSQNFWCKIYRVIQPKWRWSTVQRWPMRTWRPFEAHSLCLSILRLARNTVSSLPELLWPYSMTQSEIIWELNKFGNPENLHCSVFQVLPFLCKRTWRKPIRNFCSRPCAQETLFESVKVLRDCVLNALMDLQGWIRA